jgi:hypothetical protein
MHLVPNGVFIITTRCKDVAAMLGDPELVPELDATTGLALLTEIAPKAVAFDPDAAHNLVGAVYGLPLALVLIGKYLRRESADGDPDRTAAAFQTMAEAGHRLAINSSDDDTSHSLAEIIEVSFAALRSDEARRSILNLAIFRPKPNTFSKDIARQVAGTEPAVLYDLSDIGLIEHYGDGEYTMHRVIAEYARTKLPLTESQALHHKAVNYYARQLQQDIDDNRSPTSAGTVTNKPTGRRPRMPGSTIWPMPAMLSAACRPFCASTSTPSGGGAITSASLLRAPPARMATTAQRRPQGTSGP